MAKAPRLTGKERVRALMRLGFLAVRVRGSHHVLRHPDGRGTSVPVHAGEHIGPGLFKQILADCELTVEQIREVL